MRARPRGQKVYYYLDTGAKPRKEIPLGTDYKLAVKKWAELTEKPKPADAKGTFRHTLERYWTEIVPTKAPRTQQDNEKEKIALLKFFDDAPLDGIKPTHIRDFLRWRVKEAKLAAVARGESPPANYGQVRANRERALFSHIFNYARENDLTERPNPCQGIRRYTEVGRDVYVDAELLQVVLRHADEPTRLAMRLADATGQRPSDVLRMSERNIRSGILHIRQGKTGAKLRIEIEGELANVIEACRQYKTTLPRAKVAPLALLVNERGSALTYAMLHDRFTHARNAAGVDLGDFSFEICEPRSRRRLTTSAERALLRRSWATQPNR